MSIGEIIRQGLHYARTCKSLWIFGFFVGIWHGGSSGGGQPGGADGAAGAAAATMSPGAWSWAIIALLAGALLLLVVLLLVLRFISEGALIEGIARVRRGGHMTTREGFSAGWAHWGVLLRVALLYIAATVGSLVLLAAPVALAFRAFGPVGGVLLLPALVVGVPWLVTLYIVQAFASRIAVLDNRHAVDAIGKARLFLHGRLRHALKLIVASFAGTLLFALVAIVTVVPVVLALVLSARVWGLGPVVLTGLLVLLPVLCILAAMLGVFRSSVWTIGYLAEVEG
jgi:hypothetical protein